MQDIEKLWVCSHGSFIFSLLAGHLSPEKSNVAGAGVRCFNSCCRDRLSGCCAAREAVVKVAARLDDTGVSADTDRYWLFRRFHALLAFTEASDTKSQDRR